MKHKEPDWMPVFVLIGRRQNAHAAHPDHKEHLPAAYVENEVLRIGTAQRDADGAYLISLTALPVNGQLLMRPPRPGETADVTQKEER